MAFLDEFGEELQEEGDDEQADVHAVDIGIGGYNHLVVAQGVESVLYVEGRLQQVELLVLVDHLLGESEAVERLAPEREHRLGVHIAALGDASAGRVALGDEDAALLLALIFHVAVVYAAVAQLAVVQVGFLGPLARQFGHAGYGFSLLLVLCNLLEHHLGHVGMLVEVVVHLLLHEVAHIFIDRHPVGAHGEGAELDFGLTLEHGFLHIHGNGGHEAVADVAILEILA